MKVLISIVIGLLVVGCGKKQSTNTNGSNNTPEKSAKKNAEKETPSKNKDGAAKPVKDLTAEEKNPEPTKSVSSKLIADPILEKAIRNRLNKPTGELTKADLEKVTYLDFSDNQLTDVKGLEKHTKLKQLYLHDNQLTEVPKGLEKLKQLTFLRLEGNKLSDVKTLAKLTQLRMLWLTGNQAITKAQIAELQKALPKCNIQHHTATK